MQAKSIIACTRVLRHRSRDDPPFSHLLLSSPSLRSTEWKPEWTATKGQIASILVSTGLKPQLLKTRTIKRRAPPRDPLPSLLSSGEILPSTVVNPQDKLKDSRATDFSFLPSIFSIFSPLLSQGFKVSIFSEGRKASFLFIFLSSKFEHLWGIFNERGGERNGEGNATSQRK